MSSCPHGGSTACTVCAKEAYLLSVRFSPANLDRLEKMVGELEIQAIHNKERITELEARAALDKKMAESLCNPNVQRIIEIFARSDIDWANIKRALRAAGYLGEGEDRMCNAPPEEQRE